MRCRSSASPWSDDRDLPPPWRDCRFAAPACAVSAMIVPAACCWDASCCRRPCPRPLSPPPTPCSPACSMRFWKPVRACRKTCASRPSVTTPARFHSAARALDAPATCRDCGDGAGMRDRRHPPALSSGSTDRVPPAASAGRQPVQIVRHRPSGISRIPIIMGIRPSILRKPHNSYGKITPASLLIKRYTSRHPIACIAKLSRMAMRLSFRSEATLRSA